MGLAFQNVSHAYGEDHILDRIDLDAAAGEVTCLLGPSGCGKTTLLRLAAGLMPLQAGQISLADTILATEGSSIPPEKRPIGLVFQEGALFPHMTVEENIAFGISSDSNKKQRVHSLLKTIGLSGYEKRHPHSLSGGQQQRVALARALAPAPDVLLLDEPFANIDSQLRQDLRAETRQTLKASGTAAILVTHDPDEALEMADRIAILDQGKIVQFGTPQDLLNTPATVEIATLFARSHVIDATVEGGQLKTRFGDWPMSCIKNGSPTAPAVKLVVGRTALTLSPSKTATTVTSIRPSPQGFRVTVQDGDGIELTVQLEDVSGLAEGMAISLTPKDASILAFSAAD